MGNRLLEHVLIFGGVGFAKSSTKVDRIGDDDRLGRGAIAVISDRRDGADVQRAECDRGSGLRSTLWNDHGLHLRFVTNAAIRHTTISTDWRCIWCLVGRPFLSVAAEYLVSGAR